MKKTSLLFLTLILLSATAKAEFYSGSKLYGFLEKDQRGVADLEVGVGTGYVIGVYDSAAGILVCSPDGVSVRQVTQIVFNYMQKHPEAWEKSADISVVSALRELWPCKKN